MSEEKKYWIAFSVFPCIGPLRFKLLFEYFGSARKAWKASRDEFVAIGMGNKLISQFVKFRERFSFDRYFGNLKNKDIRVLTLLDKTYPKLLKEIIDPPYVLYYRGELTRIDNFTKTIAIVGTRRATTYGRQATRRLVERLAWAGATVVSGMAWGIDTVAHTVAIEAGGATIAVLGCGVDIVYPKSNTELYWRIIKKAGLVISEYPPGVLASRVTFPARNRIISGLCLGVVVTEGAQRSGTLITARYAAEQGREVFAVPGPITSKMSGATSILLKQGAKLVTEAEDILEEFKIQAKSQTHIVSRVKGAKAKNKDKKTKTLLSQAEARIIELLERENLYFDEIARQSKLAVNRLGSILSLMEMKGYIKNLGAGYYGVKKSTSENSTSEVE